MHLLRHFTQSFLVICFIASTSSAATFGKFTYTDQGTYISIDGYPSTEVGAVSIPATISGKPVTIIGKNAFGYCRKLTSVNIPNSVTTIKGYAFEGCRNLTSVIIPDSVTSIGYGVFYGCSGLNRVSISNSVTSIRDDAFKGCTNLTSVNIPNSVTDIGDSAFRDCRNLTSVNIPNSVTSIGVSAFAECTSLTSVKIPNSVTLIRDNAFGYCRNLTSANIPNSVTSIGNYAFFACTSLVSVDIPNSVTSIGYGVFSSCTSLTSVNIPNSVTSIGYSAFAGCSNLTKAVFLGNAPNQFGDTVFVRCAMDFTVYFQPGATGFSTPKWKGYPSEVGSPRILVLQPAGTALANPSTQEFGSVRIGSQKKLTFTVRNTGTAVLESLAMTKGGTNPAAFTAVALGKRSLLPGDRTTFTVTFTPLAIGNRSAWIRIASNGSLNNPFVINLRGKGIDPSAPAALPTFQPTYSGLRARLSPASGAGVAPVSGVTVIKGMKYLTLTVIKAPGTASQQGMVEVSSDLLDWFSGRNHTTILRNDASVLIVRDNTPLYPGAKRYIRLHNQKP